MSLLILERSLADRRRGFIGWAVGIAGYVALQTSFYPSVQNSDLQRAIANYPKELKAFFGGAQAFDFSTGQGYLQVELFSLILPALIAIAAIAYGGAALAGEHERGTLDLVLSNPVTRRRVVLEKCLGGAATVFGLTGVAAVAVAAMGAIFGLGVGLANLLIACLGVALVGSVLGMIAMLAGIAAGHRSTGIGVAAATFAASYLLVGLAGLVSWLKPFRVLSPLYHATGTQPLTNGLPVANFGILVLTLAVLIAATVLVFEHRDLPR